MEHHDRSEVMSLAEGEHIDASPLADAISEYYADDPDYLDSVLKAIECEYFEVERVEPAGGDLYLIYAHPHNIAGHGTDVVEVVG